MTVTGFTDRNRSYWSMKTWPEQGLLESDDMAGIRNI